MGWDGSCSPGITSRRSEEHQEKKLLPTAEVQSQDQIEQISSLNPNHDMLHGEEAALRVLLESNKKIGAYLMLVPNKSAQPKNDHVHISARPT